MYEMYALRFKEKGNIKKKRQPTLYDEFKAGFGARQFHSITVLKKNVFKMNCTV